jgi:hypothetical protein
MRRRHVWAVSSWLLLWMCSPALAQSRQDTTELSFVVIGHVRGSVDGARNYLFDELLDDVRALQPDLVFLTGDMIWGSYNSVNVSAETIEKDWNALDSALATLRVPVYRVPGNHDINDPVTREIYFRRYGRPPQTVDVQGVRFVLLNSAYVPPGDSLPRKRRPYIGGVPLDRDQIAFLQQSLEPTDAYRHAFVFVHHTLWWDAAAPWWKEVHPHLRSGKTRAVFAGDYGPMKFSHMSRDSVHYVQSAIEDFPALRILQRREESRLLYQQFDNYVYVTVRGGQVDFDVRVLGPMSGKKYTPERFTQMTSYERPRLERLRAAVGSPKRVAAALLTFAVVFGAGAALGLMWQRRRQ